MALRIIRPLDQQDWDRLVEDLEAGQTDEQKEFMKEAIKHANTLKVSK